MTTQNGLTDRLCTPPSLQGTALTAEKENPCENDKFPLKETIWYTVIGSSYETAITTIRNRINWNIGVRCYAKETGADVISPAAFAFTRIYDALSSNKCYALNEVACIVNSYTNHASKKEYPAYNPVFKDQAKKIIDIVHADTKKSKDRIEMVLQHLYYGVSDGSIVSWQLLDPIGYEGKKGSMDIPENIDSGERNTEGFLEDIKKYAKVGAIVIGAGAVLYVGVQAVGLFKTVKGAA